MFVLNTVSANVFHLYITGYTYNIILSNSTFNQSLLRGKKKDNSFSGFPSPSVADSFHSH